MCTDCPPLVKKIPKCWVHLLRGQNLVAEVLLSFFSPAVEFTKPTHTFFSRSFHNRKTFSVRSQTCCTKKENNVLPIILTHHFKSQEKIILFRNNTRILCTRINISNQNISPIHFEFAIKLWKP